jgi:hypothetical protein
MRLLPAISVLVLLVPVLAAAADPGPPASRPPSQVILELGWVTPYGDLGDDFATTELGFGASDGLEAGFRWRLHLSPTLSLAPAFHFANYGNFATTDEELGDVRIDCTTYRYTLELLLRTGGRDATVRPYLAAGCGLYRNRVVGYTKEFTLSFDESVNTLGFSLRAGIEVAGLEFSAVYHVNRFQTWRFFRTGSEQQYDWDSFVLRGAWQIPFGD